MNEKFYLQEKLTDEMLKDKEFKLYQLKVRLCSKCSRFINDLICNIDIMYDCAIQQESVAIKLRREIGGYP